MKQKPQDRRVRWESWVWWEREERRGGRRKSTDVSQEENVSNLETVLVRRQT